MKWTVESLRSFEAEIFDRYNKAEIPYPIHLDGGNEEHLIKYFDENFKKGDWVCGTWRMHYKCLLAGVPEDLVHQAILDGHSITLCFPEYNIISSAMVGGICSIAMGIAMGIKRQNLRQRVHCFVGDMAAFGGDFHESGQYAWRQSLPLMFIVEDNNRSVMTDTRKVWGETNEPPNSLQTVFQYEPIYPHSGTGTFVEF